MRFQLLDIVPYVEHPVTGRLVSAAERFDQTVELARRAERLGFDAFSVGERHAGRFLSSSPTVLLGAIAAPAGDRQDRALPRGVRPRPAVGEPAHDPARRAAARAARAPRGGGVPVVRRELPTTLWAIELARLRGLERVVMNSGPQMTTTHRLYERLGFARLTEREREIEDGGRRFRLLAFTIDMPRDAATIAS